MAFEPIPERSEDPASDVRAAERIERSQDDARSASRHHALTLCNVDLNTD